MERTTKDALLARIRADRARFDSALARVPPHRLAEPLLPGDWSVKDVLAHIAWGEREASGVIGARALVGSPLWGRSEEERNDAVVRESRSRSLAQVLDDYRGSFDAFVTAVGELSDAELNEPERFRSLAERIPGWPPWRVLYDPGHYDEHREAIDQAFAAPMNDRPVHDASA